MALPLREPEEVGEPLNLALAVGADLVLGHCVWEGSWENWAMEALPLPLPLAVQAQAPSRVMKPAPLLVVTLPHCVTRSGFTQLAPPLPPPP